MIRGRWIGVVFLFVASLLFVAFYQTSTKTNLHAIEFPTRLDLGEVDSLVTFEMEISNRGNETVCVVGAMSGCGCLAPTNVPLVIEANSNEMLEFQFLPKADDSKKKLELKLQLLTDTEVALPPTIISVTVTASENQGDDELTPLPMK